MCVCVCVCVCVEGGGGLWTNVRVPVNATRRDATQPFGTSPLNLRCYTPSFINRFQHFLTNTAYVYMHENNVLYINKELFFDINKYNKRGASSATFPCLTS